MEEVILAISMHIHEVHIPLCNGSQMISL